jgi:urea transport system ATP-binding protein
MAVLELRELRKEFGGLTAVDGFSLDLGEGALHALIGPNGCGKSTLFNLITGALAPSEGSVRFAGEDLTGRSPAEIGRRGIARKFQVPAVFDDLSVAENLSVPGWAGRRLAMWRRARTDAAEAVARRVRLAEKLDLPAGALSHGERQWLEIGMLLAGRPRLLLLDEPTAGMTVAETTATVELIREINRDGASVLVIEHDLGFIRDLDCPVTVMAKGRVLCSGSYRAIQADARVRELYLGRAA